MGTAIDNNVERIDAIQVLRVFGAFTISLSHIPFILNKCNIVFGVDIFLIITGFLAMYTTQQKSSLVAWKYGVKKAIRLLPLYWIMTFAAFFASLIIPGVLSETPTVGELVKSLFLVPYTRVSRITEVTVIRPIVGPAHTLMYDAYFYIIFIIASKIKFKHRGVITALFIVLIYVLSHILPHNSIYLSFFSSPWCLDLVFGIALYYVTKLMSKCCKNVTGGGYNLLQKQGATSYLCDPVRCMAHF